MKGLIMTLALSVCIAFGAVNDVEFEDYQGVPPKMNTEGIQVLEVAAPPSEPIAPEECSLGTYWLTAYCGCSKCTPGLGITASGTVPQEGYTIAADLARIPMGSTLRIGDRYFVVEDTGVKGNVLDVYFESHEDAVEFGAVKEEVFLVGGARK